MTPFGAAKASASNGITNSRTVLRAYPVGATTYWLFLDGSGRAGFRKAVR
jgi:hypothetical protein